MWNGLGDGASVLASRQATGLCRITPARQEPRPSITLPGITRAAF